jgi:hypothetical protein
VRCADVVLFCSTGVRAVELCRAIRRSKGLPTAEQ